MRKHPIKLNDKQMKVLLDLHMGVKYFYNAVTSSCPYTKNGYGRDSINIHASTFKKLFDNKLLEYEKVNLAISSIKITKEGLKLINQ